MGVNVATTYITTPIEPRASLAIKLPFLVLIVKNMDKLFSFEVQVCIYVHYACTMYIGVDASKHSHTKTSFIHIINIYITSVLGGFGFRRTAWIPFVTVKISQTVNYGLQFFKNQLLRSQYQMEFLLNWNPYITNYPCFIFTKSFSGESRNSI